MPHAEEMREDREMRSHSAQRRSGIAVLVVGLVAGGALLWVAIGGMASRVDDLVEVPVSGGVIPSSVTGEVTIFASIDGLADGRAPRPSGTITLVNHGESVVPVVPYGSNTAFNIAGRSGVAMWTATIPADSRIVLSSNGAGSNVDGWFIGHSPTTASGFVLPLVFGILALVFGLVAGLIMIVPTLTGGRAHSIRWRRR